MRAVGKGVTRLSPGDSVIVGFSSCGHCSRCDAGLPSYCREFPVLNYAGTRLDGSTAITCGGERVSSHFFGQSSFASLAIAGQAKPARERTAREKAAMTLLPMYIEEIYKPIFVVVPRMTARNVTIEPVED